MSTQSVGILIAVALLVIVAYRTEDYFDTQIAEHFIAWLFFSVMFALLPLVFNAGAFLLRGLQIKLPLLLQQGELLIVCAGIAADATGRVLLSNIDKRLTRMLAASSCIIILALSSFAFAFISSTDMFLDPVSVAELSLTIFGVTMITSIPCVLLSIDTIEN